jgi:hypothetical protein
MTMKERLQGLGYELGAQWYSFDNGLTWERVPLDPEAMVSTAASMTVIGINYDRGEITIQVNPRNRSTL